MIPANGLIMSSSKTFTAPGAEAETEGEAEAEGKTEGGTQGEPEGEGGPKGKAESTATISEAERSPAITHEPFGAPWAGAVKYISHSQRVFDSCSYFVHKHIADCTRCRNLI